MHRGREHSTLEYRPSAARVAIGSRQSELVIWQTRVNQSSMMIIGARSRGSSPPGPPAATSLDTGAPAASAPGASPREREESSSRRISGVRASAHGRVSRQKGG